MADLPDSFLTRPIAHRALHDRSRHRIENSRAAVSAAIAAGYGIEIDLQLSADGEAMVFHDDTLDRLTPEAGPVTQRSTAELTRIPLTDSSETIPRFAEILSLVAGRVPLLVEIKDQTGCLGPDTGALEARAAALLGAYQGPVALMSFNPHAVAALAEAAPSRPRGLTTCRFTPQDWPGTDRARCDDLTAIADFDRVGACFISHHHAALDTPPVARLQSRGVPILCWTIRSRAEEKAARRIAANITFESYAAAIDLAAPAPKS
ncbi:glycerophosphodiester phosphodiesterase family protein [Oceanicella sp. SM1341]|uniref:glycerophosphodiester phosphodiesterase family protein n=1 Tax=Oceanicella sp. SM1341 TaxID=1548889 RepID=UPI000E494B3E|nr:glycerophosphodiester phosphodiesterase family protein [Oceanicella sp. SM1341]